MPADDWMLAQGTVEFREEERRHASGRDFQLPSAHESSEKLVAALAAYERAVQHALKIAPTHWQRYRDPFELGEEIRAARRLGRKALSGS